MECAAPRRCDQEIVAANETGRPSAACSVERNKFEPKVPD
jgi:hypothetical protein